MERGVYISRDVELTAKNIQTAPFFLTNTTGETGSTRDIRIYLAYFILLFNFFYLPPPRQASAEGTGNSVPHKTRQHNNRVSSRDITHLVPVSIVPLPDFPQDRTRRRNLATNGASLSLLPSSETPNLDATVVEERPRGLINQHRPLHRHAHTLVHLKESVLRLGDWYLPDPWMYIATANASLGYHQ